MDVLLLTLIFYVDFKSQSKNKYLFDKSLLLNSLKGKAFVYSHDEA